MGVGGVHQPGYRSQDIIIKESDRDVDSGRHLLPGYKMTISCAGEIWAGVWFTGNNGPDGWAGYSTGSDSPLPGERPFSVLLKLNGSYQFVGTGKFLEFHDVRTPIIFRINDNTPGNGSGSFRCWFETTRSDPRLVIPGLPAALTAARGLPFRTLPSRILVGGGDGHAELRGGPLPRCPPAPSRVAASGPRFDGGLDTRLAAAGHPGALAARFRRHVHAR